VGGTKEGQSAKTVLWTGATLTACSTCPVRHSARFFARSGCRQRQF
jgi:hypothetical protein